MRYLPAAGLLLCVSLHAAAVAAGPLDRLMGAPDTPGVVTGGSFGPSGNDYYGDMRLQPAGSRSLATRYARVKPRHPKVDKPVPKS
ncbi:hypothetical protein [Methylobacterium sp. Leaf89]|uniref:hypothetical protein n=1 Tax=Methylobacterium sp. Leaf89 TaxID=1736245 RepID=UPI000701503F|nr:hypothetical protein [Methylobacterium sp. Leaf89]KQO73538.1 hypothetical protein ASF18_17325 [Methylobacterium sp. Leaf89]